MPTIPEQIVIHPLVLLSVVDHYRRAELPTGRRVLGVLLGQWVGGVVNVTNSYALPFEEDPSNQPVYFLDHNYHEAMAELYKKVSAKERPVGWYHSGPKLQPAADLRINETVFRRYCRPSPVLVVIDPVASEEATGLPVESYMAVEEIHEVRMRMVRFTFQDGSKTTMSFAHVPSTIEAEEAEEVGVEHLLRDVPTATSGLINTSVPSPATIDYLLQGRLRSLHALRTHLASMHGYVKRVQAGSLPLNHSINYALQDIFNGLPKVDEQVLLEHGNDLAIGTTVSELVRTIQALHACIDNKLAEQHASALPSS